MLACEVWKNHIQLGNAFSEKTMRCFGNNCLEIRTTRRVTLRWPDDLIIICSTNRFCHQCEIAHRKLIMQIFNDLVARTQFLSRGCDVVYFSFSLAQVRISSQNLKRAMLFNVHRLNETIDKNSQVRVSNRTWTEAYRPDHEYWFSHQKSLLCLSLTVGATSFLLAFELSGAG